MQMNPSGVSAGLPQSMQIPGVRSAALIGFDVAHSFKSGDERIGMLAPCV